MTEQHRPLPGPLTAAVPGCYRLTAPLEVGHLMGLPFTLAHIDVSAVTSRDELLSRLASALSAPVPIPNWDAFIDVLRDLSWLPSPPPHAIAITGLPTFEKGESGFLHDIERAFLDAATFWARHPADAPLLILELPAP